MCASACGAEGGSGGGVEGAGLGPGRCAPRPSRLRSPLLAPLLSLGWTPVAGLGCSPLSLLVCLSFISESELEGKCNLRRPTEGGESNPAASRSAAEHSSLPAGRPLLPAPPASWPGLGAGAAPHVIGVPGGWGVPRAGQREDGRGGGEGAEGWDLGPPGLPAPLPRLAAAPVSH